MRILCLFFLLCSVLVSGGLLEVRQSGYRFVSESGDDCVLEVGGRRIPMDHLWQVRYQQGRRTLDSGAFLAQGGRVTCLASGSTRSLLYESADLSLRIDLEFGPTTLDIRGSILQTSHTLVGLDLPASCRMPLSELKRVIFPLSCALGQGVSLLPSFFRLHAEDTGVYDYRHHGSAGYEYLFGEGPHQFDDGHLASRIELTDAGKTWFGDYAAHFAKGEHLYRVMRPSRKSHIDVSLVESKDGSLLSGHRLGGKGWLFRLGGCSPNVFDLKQGNEDVRQMFYGTMAGLVSRSPSSFAGKKFGIIDIKGGPVRGSYNNLPVSFWHSCVFQAPFLRSCGGRAVKICSESSLVQALSDPEMCMIVNPYGELFPWCSAENLLSRLDLLRSYVVGGGVWWETGGYSFYDLMASRGYMRCSLGYPDAVADFTYADYGSSSVLAYGLQPMLRRPWDRERLMCPCLLEIMGTGDHARYCHGWHFFCGPGSVWSSPTLRFRVGLDDVFAGLSEYKTANGIGGSLSAKVRVPGVLSRLKSSMLIRLHGSTCRDQQTAMGQVPRDNLIHYASYLHGGFDKQYPDHLPVRASWGSDAEFKSFIRSGKTLGHLMMPYTNTSWWCIGPKGRTFLREGDSALARRQDGSIKYETYGKNSGCSVCFWHPAVQRAHRAVRQSMHEEYLSDLLFQDQVGARQWTWNFHELEPLKASGLDGMLSLSMEDSSHVPLATEDGYDRVLNFETMLCGVAWGMIPSFGNNSSRQLRYRYPAGEWEFFPILSGLGHDQCLFTTHDLGHFALNQEVLASMLGFGYSLSYPWHKDYVGDRRRVAWLHWLNGLQKTLCREYAGRKLIDFRYLDGEAVSGRSRGLLYSRYEGDVVVIANTLDRPVSLSQVVDRLGVSASERAWLSEVTLCPYGFYGRSPRVRCGYVWSEEAHGPYGFALETVQGKLRGVFYGEVQQSLSFPAFSGSAVGSVRVTDTSGVAHEVLVRSSGSGVQSCELPGRSAVREPALQVLGRQSPRELGYSNQVLVLQFPQGGDRGYEEFSRTLHDLLCSQLRGSGLEVRYYRDIAGLPVLLRERDPKKRPFMVINCGKEVFCTPSGTSGEEMLELIRDYVLRGGIWWNSGGTPFYYCRTLGPDGVAKTQRLGVQGVSRLGLSCHEASPKTAPVELRVTAEGRRWLGAVRSARLSSQLAGCQRGYQSQAGIIPLVCGGEFPYVSSVRCCGWGQLFNLGGFDGTPELMSELVSGTGLHLYSHAWSVPTGGNDLRCWGVR